MVYSKKGDWGRTHNSWMGSAGQVPGPRPTPPMTIEFWYPKPQKAEKQKKSKSNCELAVKYNEICKLLWLFAFFSESQNSENQKKHC